MTDDVKVTPTEADRALYKLLLELPYINRGRREGGEPILEPLDLIARHRLQGWSECRKAAKAEQHEADDTAYTDGWNAACHRISTLTPSTPESDTSAPECDHDWQYSGTDGHGSHKGEDLYSCTICRKLEYRQ